MPLSVLVTAFRLFGGRPVNASQETVRRLTEARILAEMTVPSWISLQLSA